MRRSGLTLVELLAVLAIAATLLGLLLPGVQAVREAAARAKCANNLKQITLALAHYEAARGEYPPGNDPLDWTDDRLTGWLESLGPFAEFGPAHADTPGILYCPSRRGKTQGVYADGKARGLCDYATVVPDAANGLIVGRRGKGVRAAWVTDGLSNTLAVGEKRLIPGNAVGWGVSNDDQGWSDAGLDNDVCVWAGYELRRDFAADSACGTGWGPPGSAHPTGMNAGYADGSARVIRYGVWPAAVMAMATRAGGETGESP